MCSSKIKRTETIKQTHFFRRSVIAAKDIDKGEIVNRNHLELKRPGNGHPPSDLAKFVGSKALKKIKSDTVISLKDFKNI